jgi:hypothetical protein
VLALVTFMVVSLRQERARDRMNSDRQAAHFPAEGR